MLTRDDLRDLVDAMAAQSGAGPADDVAIVVVSRKRQEDDQSQADVGDATCVRRAEAAGSRAGGGRPSLLAAWSSSARWQITAAMYCRFPFSWS